MLSKRFPIGLILFVCFHLSQTGFAATASAFSGLGFLSGGNYSAATAISKDGTTIVGGSQSSFGSEAFRWTSATGMVGLGSFNTPYISEARGVSHDGSVVIVQDSGVIYAPWRWTQGGGKMGIYFGNPFYGDDISGDGTIVVGSNGESKAFRWTPSSGMQELGHLTGGVYSRAFAISDNGQVIVGEAGSANVQYNEAFRWTSQTGMVGLGTLPGCSASSAMALSNDGAVVVGKCKIGDTANGPSFRWTETSGMISLGSVSGGNFYSHPFGVSGDGSVIVGDVLTGANRWGQEAFLWTADRGMIRVKDILEKECGLNLGGWILNSAHGVSEDGLTLVGWGINPAGQQEAWMATIPEPATLLLLGLGGMMMGRKKQ